MKRKALWMAVVTTLLWSGSYILNKLAFGGGIGPLTLSGLRYVLAALLLMGVRLIRRRADPAARGQRGDPAGQETPQAAADGDEKPKRGMPLRLIVLLGLLGYAVAQGLQYVGQSYLTPTQSSLCLSVGNTAMVMLADRLWLRENQTGLDLVKLAALLGGIALYYYPWGAASLAPAGFLFMALSSVGYAAQMTLNRRLLRAGDVPPRALVAGPMLAGGAVLLAAGLALEGPPPITGQLVLMLLYLGGVSGALGFHLWTSSQSSLTAFKSSGINNLMLVEIALMDWLAFRRTFSALQIAAILLVFGAIVWIQTGRNTPKRKTPDPEPGRT